jgi:hypothetical protein
MALGSGPKDYDSVFTLSGAAFVFLLGDLCGESSFFFNRHSSLVTRHLSLVTLLTPDTCFPLFLVLCALCDLCGEFCFLIANLN